MKELKKLDDKALLVEVQLLESKVYHNLSNIPKSRFEKQIICLEVIIRISVGNSIQLSPQGEVNSG